MKMAFRTTTFFYKQLFFTSMLVSGSVLTTISGGGWHGSEHVHLGWDAVEPSPMLYPCVVTNKSTSAGQT